VPTKCQPYRALTGYTDKVAQKLRAWRV